MHREVKLTIPLYGFKLKIIQVKELSVVGEKYGLEDLHGIDAFVFRKYRKNGSPKYYLVFSNKVTPGYIAHEALHLVGLIYEDIHAVLEIENDEPQCYLIEWIVDQCHKHIKVK